MHFITDSSVATLLYNLKPNDRCEMQKNDYFLHNNMMVMLEMNGNEQILFSTVNFKQPFFHFFLSYTV